MAADKPIRPTLRQQHIHEYNCWKAMRSRCQNPKNASWPDYGGKGIKVCERWQRSFEAFLEDIGPAPTPRHQIDRIDGTKDYEPFNVFWSTPAEQQANTSKVLYLTCRGVTLSVKQWSDIFDIPAGTIHARITLLGWSEEDAVRTPVDGTSRPKPTGRPPKKGSRRWKEKGRGQPAD